ncbi:MAG: DEAD/DEAH box helicase family protein [Balneolales bacterium]|nr:DEAD/DEAH box helicase family protein [Balneolales bacterium]
MKIKFNSSLDFQQDAFNSVTKVFEGQETGFSRFTVSALPKEGFLSATEGSGNTLKLLEEDVLKNVQSAQIENGLRPDEKLNSMDFTIEMETGTGKTYVYLRSMFEMHKKYGFLKFIIVVPSVAIREGVHKSLKMTEQHFNQLYDNTPFDYFVYDSDKLGQVRSFATSQHMQIMIINIDAFRRSFTNPEELNKANIIHRPHDRMNGQKPIEYIQATNPVVIIDEPQSVDTTTRSAEAITSLNPLCTFRYSATHIDKYHMLYKLDSVDAYERKLVKQIEVAGIQIDDAHNKAFVEVHDINNKKGRPEAAISFDQLRSGSVSRVKRRVSGGEDLFEMSGGRSIYDGYIISEIYAEKGYEYVRFANDVIVRLGQHVGGVDEDTYKRLQIRKTIDMHLEKEKMLRPRGIKVLSLFFIDRVSNYRIYDEDGNEQQGKYARMFEEEYNKAIQQPKYHMLFEGVDKDTIAAEVHDGYFSIDSKGRGSNKKEYIVDTSGETQKDGDTYNLIMKDKERLLSLDTKLKFIFSHSALREGWDNPNVFQICTLNESGSTIKKRQEIGRGLRIAVNQEGERVHGFEVNTLTVMANESYEDFARQLQKEIEEEEGIRFGVIERHSFAGIPVQIEDGETKNLGVDQSENIWGHMLDKGYIDEKGRIQDKLRLDIKANVVNLPEAVEKQKPQITALLRKLAGKLNVKNADDKRIIKVKKEVLLDGHFKALWDKIKYKTTYRVDFDSDTLIVNCTNALKKELRVGKARFRIERSKLNIDRGGVHTGEVDQQTQTYTSRDFPLPDILSILQDATQLTRKSLAKMLIDSGRLNDFTNNPQKFIEQAIDILRSQMRLVVVDGIKYQKIGDDHFFAQELFENEELFGYLDKNMLESKKSVYDHVVYDSDVERNFAQAFEKNDAITLYAKLPDWFKIDTPLGTYNPDWAVVYENEGEHKLYFVVETKGNLFSDALRPTEYAKIECGRQHFKAMNNDVKYELASNFDSFLDVTG